MVNKLQLSCSACSQLLFYACPVYIAANMYCNSLLLLAFFSDFESSLRLLAALKRPPVLAGYRVNSKATQNHFWRYSDFKVKGTHVCTVELCVKVTTVELCKDTTKYPLVPGNPVLQYSLCFQLGPPQLKPI